MNFFETLSQIGITDVIIQFEKAENGQTTIFVAPKSISVNNPLKSLNPIFMTGTAREVDSEFFLTLTNHLVLAKEEAGKALSKAQQIKALSDAQPKKIIKEEPKTETTYDEGSVSDILSAEQEAEMEAERQFERDEAVMGAITPEIKVPAPKPVKEVKVNNEKPLKDFITSLGKDADILLHIPQIEELYAKLSEAELDKPYAKKVRIDMDIRLRKEENYQAAKAKFGFTPKPTETVVENIEVVGEEVQPEEDIDFKPLTTKETFAQRNALTEVPAPEFVPIRLADTEENFEKAPEEIKEVIANISNEVVFIPGIPQEIQEMVQASPNVHFVTTAGQEKAQSPIETPIAPPPTILPPPPAPVMVEKLVMIVEDGTYENYIGAGWTDELLLQHGKAEMKMVASTPTSLKYTFPKPFDQ